mgnify:CR=1 FL=1
MRRNRLLYLILIPLIGFQACIEEYQPEIDKDDIGLYVVEGKVLSTGGMQTVRISISTSVYNPSLLPVNGCSVNVVDDEGNNYIAGNADEGVYQFQVPQMNLDPGCAFKLEIITPEGELIESAWDTIQPNTEIDSVFYRIEEFYSEEELTYIPGIQFYVDFNGKDTHSKYIKFEVEETWKYESAYPLRWTYYNRVLTTYDPPDYSKFTCWKTRFSPSIFTFSTMHLDENRYKDFPLHHVMNNSIKLLKGYSLLFRQLVISEDAFLYYEKIKDNIVETGGLYESQPQQIEGNLKNLTNPENRVLGYFLAAGASDKRVFIDEIEGLELDPPDLCSPVPVSLGFLRYTVTPLYLWMEGGTSQLHETCVDCTKRGGETTKPTFWPDEN